MRQQVYLRVCFQGDTAGSPECNSSICCFNNSAARCISLLVHQERGNGGPRHLRRGEVTGDKAADTVHHVLPSSAASQSSTPPSDIAGSPDLCRLDGVSPGDGDTPGMAAPQHVV